ncbi:hypothetical protein ACJIZ3_025091 [Penstemon smallii]|uniref:Uncharacterized protein n=1 Tax=Penstemon smallii TaxID=265156 RepID=A0ABD3TU01_9LAMI
MFGDKSETPTRILRKGNIGRQELLSMVRKHSKLIGQSLLDEDETSDVEMDSKFWHDIIDLYFVRGRESRGRQDDDLLFFVRKLSLQPQRPNDNTESNSPYFVRRWAPKVKHYERLFEVIAEESLHVDVWNGNIFKTRNKLMIMWNVMKVIQTEKYKMLLVPNASGVVIVEPEVLIPVVLHLSFIYQFFNLLFLTTFMAVLSTLMQYSTGIEFFLILEERDILTLLHEVETTPAYPDICFAVDDFDSTFDAVGNINLNDKNNYFIMVLTDTDHCYCVLLNAHEGSAFPCEKTEQGNGSNISSSEAVPGAGKIKNSKVGLRKSQINFTEHTCIITDCNPCLAIELPDLLP